jgi:hypothetical protein
MTKRRFCVISLNMKKLGLFLFFCISSWALHAQIFQGFGIMAGATAGRQKWLYYNPDFKVRQKFLIRYNAEIFAEFGMHPTFRYVTELQYNVKGTKQETPAGTNKFQNQYGAWNNYLMIRREFFMVIPYAKIGPRLEYVFASDNDFTPFHITGSAGAGVEFVAYGPVKFITEFHWVPDLTKSFKSDPLVIKQHCWELRVGIKFGRRGSALCPAYKDQPND